MTEITSAEVKQTIIKHHETKVLSQQHAHYMHQATAPNTRRAYRAAITHFERQGGQLPATAQMIGNYLTQQATLLNPRTLSLHLTALSHWHQYQGFIDPTQSPSIRKLLKGIARTHGQPKRQAKALSLKQVQQMVAYCEQQHDRKHWRNSALIQVAYFGAFRRSELVAIDIKHVQFEPQGMLIVVPRSKTDQTGKGNVKALPYGQGTRAQCMR